MTVSRLGGNGRATTYRLVCGQGRLEAYRELGERTIPAFVRDMTDGDAYLMSLVENIARRKPKALEAVSDIKRLKSLGYSNKKIAEMTDLSVQYLRDIVHLFEAGEERLISAVNSGRVPIHIAAQISRLGDGDVQVYFQKLFESRKIDKDGLKSLKKLAIDRKKYGQKYRSTTNCEKGEVTAKSLLASFKSETKKQNDLIAKYDEIVRTNAASLAGLRTLLSSKEFRHILQQECLDAIPSPLQPELMDSHSEYRK